jgi:hypothetical protein
MRKSTFFLALTILVFATRADAGSMAGLDLSGTWTGKGSCTGLVQGEKFTIPSNVTVEISTFGNEFAAAFGFVGTGTIPLTVDFSGCGFAIAESAKPDRGRAAVLGFEESAPYMEFGTADLSKVSVFSPDKKGRTGKMKGTILGAVRDAGDLILSCKLTVERTSQVDPGIPFCLAPTMTVN